MYPYILEIGNFKLASYGVFSALAYLSAIIYLNRQKKQTQISDKIFWNIITVLIISALLGAKLLYIVIFWQYFDGNFFGKIFDAIKDFRFGFVYFGGFISALVCGIWYVKKKSLSVTRLADFFAPAIALGHSIGRLGCFFAGCCYGKPATSAFAVKFTNPQSLIDPGYLGVPVHPAQLYEAGGNFIIFLILHFMLKQSISKKLKTGRVMLAYILGYAVLRFTIEFFRGDDRGGFTFGLSPSQIIAIAVICITPLVYGVWFKKEQSVCL